MNLQRLCWERIGGNYLQRLNAPVCCLLVLSWLLAGPSGASELKADLMQAQWGGCPQLFSSDLRLQAIPLQLTVARVDVDLSCWLQQGKSPDEFTLESLKPLAQQWLQGLQALPSTLSGVRVQVQRLQVKASGQVLFSGELQVKQQGQQWQVHYQQADQSWLKLQLLPKVARLQLDGRLTQPSLSTLAHFTQQGWLQDPALADADFSLVAEPGERLRVSAELQLPALGARLKAQLTGWQNWQLTLHSSGFHWQEKNWPGFAGTLQAQRWQLKVDDWQLAGEGEWRIAPQLQLSGQLSSAHIGALQQALFPLAKPAKLLSGAMASRFTWQAQQLSSQVKVSGLNALWGEFTLSDAQLEGTLDYQAPRGWKHAGLLQLQQWDIGFPLQDITLRWQQPDYAPLGQWRSLRLADISFNTLGGQGKLAQLALDLPSDGSLQLRQIQLDRLAQLYPELALTMQGAVSGTLPLQLTKQGLAIRGGSLAVFDPPGHIALRHQSLVALKAQHPSLDFALSLLEDFDYEKLTAELDFAEDGQLDMLVQLIGRNQQLSPRLVTLNYHHQENIYQLLRSLRIGQQLSGQLQKWIDDSAFIVSPSP